MTKQWLFSVVELINDLVFFFLQKCFSLGSLFLQFQGSVDVIECLEEH